METQDDALFFDTKMWLPVSKLWTLIGKDGGGLFSFFSPFTSGKTVTQ